MFARGLRFCLLAGLTVLSGCALFGGRPAGPEVVGSPLHKLNVHTTTVSMRVEAVDRTLKRIARQETGKANGVLTARKSFEEAVAHHRAAESVAASLPERPGTGVHLEAARNLVKLQDVHLTGIGNTLARYAAGKGDLVPVQLAAARYLRDYWQVMTVRNRDIALIENKGHPPTAQSYFNMASFQMAEMLEGIWKQRVALLEGGDPGAAFMAAYRHADDLNLKIQDSIAMGGQLADKEIADAGQNAGEKLDPATERRITEARRYKAALVQHTVTKALLANVIGMIFDKEEDWMKSVSLWDAKQQAQTWQAIDALRLRRLDFQRNLEDVAHSKTAAAQ